MINIPKVIDNVVNNDLCIGCGLCVYKCSSLALEIRWSEYGFLIPELTGNCNLKGDCLLVCPFNPSPQDKVKTENEISKIYLYEAIQFHEKIGRYNNIYVGYSNDFRTTSSSGGIATYILTELLKEGIVDHIFSVKESKKSGVHYEYGISSTYEELLNSSKTKYFPVTLDTVFPKINAINGKIAIVGVACFIKAIRLAQQSDPLLKEKIPFLVGIICGGLKSRFFTEYLASKLGVPINNIQKPQFRIKDLNSVASDYSFGCIDSYEIKEKTLKMQKVGDMWGTGLFKANACDFCDDVTTELADISLGDAWLYPYVNDGYGTNVIVTRSFLSDYLIQKGIINNKINVENIPFEKFINSQLGSFNHRHNGLAIRLKIARNNNVCNLTKRHIEAKVSLSFRLVQKYRMITREKSLEQWKKNKNISQFENKLKRSLSLLKIFTKIYHYDKHITTKVEKIIKYKKR